MAYILQSTRDETMYFTGTRLGKEISIFIDDIERARKFDTSSEASQVKAVLVDQPTKIIEV